MISLDYIHVDRYMSASLIIIIIKTFINESVY